jgi:hypothetical protein
VSWDVNDDLWAVLDGGLVLFRGAKGSKEPLSDRVTVAVASPVSAVRVAPDGVRVALVTSGGLLRIGAISGQDGPSPLVTFSEVQVKPINGATMFTGLSWYGPDDVITLAKPGPVATAYPVNGGSPVSIPVEPGMTSITSTLGSQLVAGLPDGHMVTDAGLAGAWTTLGNGFVPSYPG